MRAPASKALWSLNFPLVLKEHAPLHLVLLMWSRRGKRVMGLESCQQSKIKNGFLIFFADQEEAIAPLCLPGL